MANSDITRRNAQAAFNRHQPPKSHLELEFDTDTNVVEFPAVLLQLELPDERGELRDIFACQLAVPRSEWQESQIYKGLCKSDVFCGIVHFADKQLAGEPWKMLRLVSILGEFYRIERRHAHFHLELNSVLRVTHVERYNEGEVHLVRATIESGGLLFKKPTSYHGPGTHTGPSILQKPDLEAAEQLQDRLWPDRQKRDERVAGIFFTGSELQIEIGTPGAKKTTGIRRFRLLQIRRAESGRVRQAIWQQVAAIDTLSAINVDVHPEPPATTITAHLARLKALCSQLSIEIAKDSIQAAPGASVIVCVDGIDSDAPTYRELIQLRGKLFLHPTFAGGPPTGLFEAVGWRPQAMEVFQRDKEYSVALLDRDEVEMILGTNSNATVMELPKPQFRWGHSLPKGPELLLPETRLVGTSARTANGPEAAPRDLWFLATCGERSPYPNLPPVWANLSFEEPPGTPSGDGLRTARLDAPIKIALQTWMATVVPAASPTTSGARPASVRLVLAGAGTGSVAELTILNPDVTLDSPPISLLNLPLNDPRSVPNERRPELASGLECNLRFVHRAESDGEQSPPIACSSNGESPADRYIRAQIQPDTDSRTHRVVIQREPEAIRLFVPADRALVDPVSASGGNLVATQRVAFPIYAQNELTIVDKTHNGNISITFARRGLRPLGPLGPGFFVELQVKITKDEKTTEATWSPLVLPLSKATFEAEKLQLTFPPEADVSRLLTTSNATFDVMIGTTQLVLPRDVNHGLVPIGVSTFSLDQRTLPLPALEFCKRDADNDDPKQRDVVTGRDGGSVLALHPWTAWKPDPLDWRSTGGLFLYHRNLIQEHAEFEASFEDRFPPEGPPRDPQQDTVPSPLLPLEGFLRAVRARYSRASGNLLRDGDDARQLRNWLPGSQFVDRERKPVSVRVAMNLDGELPETTLEAKGLFSGQSLKLRKADEPGADRNWLDTQVRAEKLPLAQQSVVRLTPVDALDVTSRRAMDSSVPLLFARHDVTALAIASVPETDQVVVFGGGSQAPAEAYVLGPQGRVIAKTASLPNLDPTPWLTVCLHRHIEGGTIRVRGMALGNDHKLRRFLVKFSEGAVSLQKLNVFDLPNGAVPIAICAGPEHTSPDAVVLARAGGHAVVTVVDLKSGTMQSPAALQVPNATAIAFDRTVDGPQLAIGCADGSMQLWHKPNGAWQLRAGGAPLPLDPDQTPTVVEPLALRSIAIGTSYDISAEDGATERGDHPVIVASDATGRGVHWHLGAETPGHPAQPSPLEQTAQILCVGFGHVNDLDDRRSLQGTRALSLVACGLRSGEVLISTFAHNGEKSERVDLRLFDAAAGPITRLALPTLSPQQRIATNGAAANGSARSAPLWIGSAAGTVLGWDLRRGIEWPTAAPADGAPARIEPLRPATFVDALGVIRELRQDVSPSPSILAARLSVKRGDQHHAYLSLTAHELPLASSPTDAAALHAQRLTDIRLWADAFKVHEGDGSVDPTFFADAEFDLGRVAFFSRIEAAPGSGLERFDYLPRLDGVPLFVTRVHSLTLSADRQDIVKAVLEGVLINPDDVAAGQDPADFDTVPGIVARALSRKSTIMLTLTPSNPQHWSIDSDKSRIDWTLNTARQLPIRDPQDGAPGQLACLVSKLGSVRRHELMDILCFEVDLRESQAFVFDRLWNFAEGVGPLVTSNASFSRHDQDSPWLQSAFRFRTQDAPLDSADVGDILKCERLAPRQMWEEPENQDHVPVAGHPFAWDVRHAEASRYLSFTDGTQVYLADRTTGWAARSTSRIFHAPSDDHLVTATALLASEETVSAQANPEVRAKTLTIGVGRAKPDGTETEIEFVRVREDDISAESRVTWFGEMLKGKLDLRLTHALNRGGALGRLIARSDSMRFEVRDFEMLPQTGERIHLEPPESQGEYVAIDVIASDRGGSFALAKDVDEDTVAKVRYLQFVDRLDGAVAIDATTFSVQISASETPLAIGDRIRTIATGASQFATVVKVVTGGVEVDGLTTLPLPGSRWNKLVPIDAALPADVDRPTVRLTTDARSMPSKNEPCVLLHGGDANLPELCFVEFIDNTTLDLYRPADLPGPLPDAMHWRAVAPIRGIQLSDGTEHAARITLGAHDLSSFTPIALFGITNDDGTNNPLNASWWALPDPTAVDHVFLTTQVRGSGTPVDAAGNWKRPGGADANIVNVSNSSNAPVSLDLGNGHGLATGDEIVITGFSAAGIDINGPARVQVAGDGTLMLYRVAIAPPAGSAGYWERTNRDTPIASVEWDHNPIRFVVESEAEAPHPFSRFRLIGTGAPPDILIARRFSRTTWAPLKAAEAPANGTSWSPLAAVDPSSGQFGVDPPSALLESLHGKFPFSPGRPAIAIDETGLALAGDRLWLLRIDERAAHLAAEVKAEELTALPSRWSAAIAAIAIVAELGGHQFAFDFLPDFTRGGMRRPRGTTTRYATPLSAFESGHCAGRLVAVSAHDKRLFIWGVDVVRANACPSQVLDVNSPIKRLVIRECGNRLLILALSDAGISSYLLSDLHIAAQTLPWQFDGVALDKLGAITLGEIDQQLILVAGLTADDRPTLSSWRLPLTTSGVALPEAPVRIWPSPLATDTIRSIVIGQVAGCPQLAVTFLSAGKERIEIWAPDGFLVIRSESDPRLSPQASLAIDFKRPDTSLGQVHGRLAPARTVDFFVQPKDSSLADISARQTAHLRLRQASYQCLMLSPTTADASRGHDAVLLWPGGDLTNIKDSPVGTPRLSAASVRLINRMVDKIDLHLTIDGRTTQRKCFLRQVMLAVDVNNPRNATARTISLQGTLYIETVWNRNRIRLLLEGEAISSIANEAPHLSGVMIVEPSLGAPDQPPIAQLLVRCSLKILENTVKIGLVNDVCWKSRVLPESPSAMQSEPDIEFPTMQESDDPVNRRAFAVVPFSSAAMDDIRPGLVQLTIDGQGSSTCLAMRRVDQRLVPLMPEVEPTRLREPERLDGKIVRLAHRRRGGLAMRPDASRQRYPEFSLSLKDGTTEPFDLPLASLLLEPIVNVGGPLHRLRPEGWLQPVPPSQQAKDAAHLPTPRQAFRTDGLCVINADLQASTSDDQTAAVLTAVESRTYAARNATDFSAERTRCRQLLHDAGAQGVALQFAVVDGSKAEFGFVDSPFYDQDRPGADTAAVGIPAALPNNSTHSPNLPPSPASPLAELATRSRVASSFIVDPRILRPEELDLRRAPSAGGSPEPTSQYALDDLPCDPYQDTCCLAQRQYRLLRTGKEQSAGRSDDDTPIVAVSDHPLFAQPARTSPPNGGAWRYAPTPYARPFFPKRIEWELAADKPGAMFQTLIQARRTDTAGHSRREPLIDFALREPQQIRLGRCVTAAVEWDVTQTEAVKLDRWANFKLTWNEILGQVRLEELAHGSWLRFSDDRFEFSQIPLELIVDFNSEVLPVLPPDAAVPGYRIEPQGNLPNGAVKPILQLAAPMYAVAGQDFDIVTAPQTVPAAKDIPGKVSREGEANPAYLLKLDDPHAALISGARIQLLGFTVAELEGSTHRLLREGDKYRLMQELWNTTDTTQPKISWDGNAAVEAQVIAQRPFVVSIPGTDDLTGKKITIENAPAVELFRLSDATAPGELVLCRTEPNGKEYLVLTPTAATLGVDDAPGNVAQVFTHASGYLELSVRQKATLTLLAGESANRWGTLVKLSELKSGPRYVCLQGMQQPELNGVFRVLATPDTAHLLARPSASRAVIQNGGPGTAAAIPGGAPVTIDKVAGGSPICIQLLGESPAWTEGTAVVVKNVRDVPEANGTWVVAPAKEETNAYELHEPAVAPRSNSVPENVTIRQVEPLAAAFPRNNDGISPDDEGDGRKQIRKLSLATRWEVNDRPLLQVYWAGVAGIAAKSGGVAWQRGGLSVELYSSAKQIKFLANSQLNAKLAFVCTLMPGSENVAAVLPALQRTILFGNSAPAFKTLPTIKLSEGTRMFVLEIRDNREFVSVPLPPKSSSTAILHLVKTLPSGVAVFDRIKIEIKES